MGEKKDAKNRTCLKHKFYFMSELNVHLNEYFIGNIVNFVLSFGIFAVIRTALSTAHEFEYEIQ